MRDGDKGCQIEGIVGGKLNNLAERLTKHG
jgi:hypothetical protein